MNFLCKKARPVQDGALGSVFVNHAGDQGGRHQPHDEEHQQVAGGQGGVGAHKGKVEGQQQASYRSQTGQHGGNPHRPGGSRAAPTTASE